MSRATKYRCLALMVSVWAVLLVGPIRAMGMAPVPTPPAVDAIQQAAGPIVEPPVAPVAPDAPDAPDPVTVQREANKLQAKNLFESLTKQHAQDKDMLVLPGLLADRAKHQVTLWVEATHLADDAPVEFFLIPTDSGKDYEALAITFAKPSDVHRALVFIGLTPGRRVDYANDLLWPRGPRVSVTFHWDEPAETPAGKVTPRAVAAWAMLADAETKKPLAEHGLVFTGSYWAAPATQPAGDIKRVSANDGLRYAADFSDSRSIASNYNEPSTVLDVPAHAPRSLVYATMQANPAYRFGSSQMFTVVLEPKQPVTQPIARDVVLEATLPAGATGTTFKDLQFTLREGAAVLVKEQSITHAVAALGKLPEAGPDVFLTVKPPDAMPLQRVSQLYAMLRLLENPEGIRLDAAPAGHLFHLAFLPNPQTRDRANRLSQPFELHVTPDGKGGYSYRMIHLIEDWNTPKPPKITEEVFTVTQGVELVKLMDEKDPRPPHQLYVFAPADMPYGTLRAMLGPALESHPDLAIYFPEKN